MYVYVQFVASNRGSICLGQQLALSLVEPLRCQCPFVWCIFCLFKSKLWIQQQDIAKDTTQLQTKDAGQSEWRSAAWNQQAETLECDTDHE